jgi:hypothetical protein
MALTAWWSSLGRGGRRAALKTTFMPPLHVLPLDLYVDGWNHVSERQAVVTARRRLAGLSAQTPTPPSAGTLLSRTRRLRADPLSHDNVGTCVAQGDGPAGRVLEEERLERAATR